MKWYHSVILACGLAFVAPQISSAQPAPPPGNHDPRGGAHPGHPGQPGYHGDKKDDHHPGHPGHPGPNAGHPGNPGHPGPNAGHPGPNAGHPGHPGPNAGHPGNPGHPGPNAGHPGPNAGHPGHPGPNAGHPGKPGVHGVAVPPPAPGMMPMNPAEFSNLLYSVDRATFGSNKVSRIRDAAKRHHFSADQVRQLMKHVNFENDKITVAVELYHRVVDKHNWHVIYSALTFSSSKIEVDRRLGL